jgi:hypothetical protein
MAPYLSMVGKRAPAEVRDDISGSEDLWPTTDQGIE